MKKTAAIFFLAGFVWMSAQNDSIYIGAKLSSAGKMLDVEQEIIYYNRQDSAINEVKLLNWISAYKKRGTALYKRKIEDRNRDLHFAKPEELGKMLNLKAEISDAKTENSSIDDETVYLKLPKTLQPDESVKINLNYQLQLPIANFTGYGRSDQKTALKYFFLVPDGFEEVQPVDKKFIDTEETASHSTFWTVNLDLPSNYYSESNLTEIQPNYFKGFLSNDPEFLISSTDYPEINTSIDGKPVKVSFGYTLTEAEKQHLEFYLPLQLQFVHEKTGLLPQKIFISEKFKKKEDFFGNDDIKFWKFRFPLFTEAENTDLDYFSIISKNILEQSFALRKEDSHWFKNGIKSYLEIQYLKRYYKDHKLLGALPEAEILGMKPLKIFHASKLKLIERYGIAYQYMMTQNLDQKIDENFSGLSNFNEMAISNFETGSLLNFVSEKMETEKFDVFLKDYLQRNSSQTVNTDEFLNQLAVQSGYSASFMKDLIARKHRVNFNLKKYRREGENLTVKVKKNEPDPVPFKLETFSKNGDSKTYWFDTPEHPSTDNYVIPDHDAEKIVINSGHYFPESTFRDNYVYTKGVFSNTKKIRFKLLRDVPNPEFNEIYINPKLTFNAYDKLLLGLNFKNKSLFNQKFEYSVTPYYSTGTGKFTGSAGISYSFMPPESFYRNLTVGMSGSYFHYDYDLSYRRMSAYANINFTKNPRSAIGRSAGISYNHYQKELTPQMIADNEYDRYNLWGANYSYSDNRLIHEKFAGIGIQGMEDFQKITGEAFYRYEFAKNKKISFRFFGGYFLNNKTRNDLFDFGISKVSNYSFSYGLIGQSATSGILAQQFILADGGFKSYIGSSVNQWITSINVDSHVWKMFNVYADAGVYKNKGFNPEFIWDSGVKVRIIPDFLEVYLPVYSSLGFEPSLKDYGKRIRFTLVLNLNAVVNTVRRGWY